MNTTTSAHTSHTTPTTTGSSHTEHSGVMDLVKHADATHVAVNDGKWFDASTWANNEVPGADAKVVIPHGISVLYNGSSDASLMTVRIDGELDFAYWRDTKMVVDTMVVSPEGRLQVGSEANPIQADKTVEIIIADNGDIDTNWDPGLLSRGIIGQGEVSIHGAEKEAFVKVLTDPMAGDTVLELGDVPQGWQVGDTLVLTGTHKQGWDRDERHGSGDGSDYRGTEDEEVTIVAIDASGRVTLDRALQYDHDTPAADLKAYVSNMTRNVTISSESGDASEVHHRGHVMFMHNDQIDVRYAAFDDLGRTDKSFTSASAASFTDIESDSNVQGRYALHLHRTGLDDPDNPVQLIGNAVSGTPGWGIVQHSSNAVFAQNAVYDAFGAAFVAESGNDIGEWHNNIAIDAQGIGWGTTNTQNHQREGDNGRTGDGFFFASRLVESSENVAANTTHGFTYAATNGAQADGLSGASHVSVLDTPEIAESNQYVNVVKPTIVEFRDNEAFGSMIGFSVIRTNPNQGHDLRSVLEDFTAWEVFRGINARYSPHYTVIDARIIGTETEHNKANSPAGIRFERKAFDWTINGADIENFDIGIDTSGHDEGRSSDNRVAVSFIDVTFDNVTTDYLNTTTEGHQILTSADLVPGRLAAEYSNLGTIRFGEDVSIDWLKVDSIGTIDRVLEFDRPYLAWNPEIVNMLRNDGYYTDQNGQKVLLFVDLIADRATGDFQKLITELKVELTDEELASIRAKDNGDIVLGGPAPIAGGDRVRVEQDEPTDIRLLDNDSDPDGGHIFVDGYVQPKHGELITVENGVVRYVPDFEFTGVDSFSYFLRDEEGNVTRGEVSVRVGDGAIPDPIVVPVVDAGDFTEALNENFAPVAIQNRPVFVNGETELSFNPLENDHDANGDELFLTSFYRGSGIEGIDVRLDAEGNVFATAEVGAEGLAPFYYEISDGNGGVDDGIAPHFIGRNNAPTPADAVKVGASDVPDISVTLVDAESGVVLGDIEHLSTFDLLQVGNQGVSFQVDSPDYDIGSVAFYLNDQLISTDNGGLFTAFGENGAAILGQALKAGDHHLRVVATSEDSGEGHLFFDNRAVFTTTKDTPTPGEPDGSLIDNGSFENGVGNWLLRGGQEHRLFTPGDSSARTSEGGGALPLGGWSTGVGQSVQQGFETEVGKNYRLSFDAGVNVGDTATMRAGVFEREDGFEWNVVEFITDTSEDPGLETYVLDFTATASESHVRFWLVHGDSADFDIDNVSIVEWDLA